MPILNVLKYPDPKLRRKALPVEVLTDEDKQLIEDMFETMYEGDGIGLAATQVGALRRIIVMDLSDNRSEPICLVNPEITHKEGYEKSQEGCLSVPGIYEEVERAKVVTVKALDRYGDHMEFEADELFAVCIQHEIDHLDGKLFIDYLSGLKKKMIKKKIEKNRRRTL